MPLQYDFNVTAPQILSRQQGLPNHQRAWSDPRAYRTEANAFLPHSSAPIPHSHPNPQSYATGNAYPSATVSPMVRPRSPPYQSSGFSGHPEAAFLEEFSAPWSQPMLYSTSFESALLSLSHPQVPYEPYTGSTGSVMPTQTSSEWNLAIPTSDRPSPALSAAYGSTPFTWNAPSPAVSTHSSGCESVSVSSVRKRRIDTSQSPQRTSSQFSALDGEHSDGGTDAKRPRWTVSETQHVHIVNVECPHMDCIGPIHGNGGDKYAPGSFICGYVEPLSGQMCASEFRRRGCRDRHSASHSGREAQVSIIQSTLG